MSTPYEEGSPDRAICILAEAPSRSEMRLGVPLVGPTGHLFNECLHAAGILRAECYILNVWEEEVWKDKLDGKIFDHADNLLWTAKSGFTAYGLEKASGCIARLRRSAANVFVPMGGPALSLLYGDTRITKWRGSILASSRMPGRKLVPTLHPAFSLHGNYPYRYVIQSDFRRVKEEADTPLINLPKRELIIDPSFNEVCAFIRDMHREREVALDIEVLNHQISCLSFAPRPDTSMCIPMIDGKGHRWTEGQEVEIWMLIAELMENPSVAKVNQNLLFDIAFMLEQNGIFTKGRLDCTMCAQGIMYTDFPKSLEFITSIRTREPYYKDDRKIWSKPWVDMERFWIYNAKDSAVALECHHSLMEEIGPYEETYRGTIDLFEPLMAMMIHGVPINRVALAETNTAIKKEILRLEQELKDASEWNFNPASPKQCREYFYVTKGIKPYLSMKTGAITCDDKAMARIWKRYQLPEARLVQEIRAKKKLLSSYLEVGIDRDNYLRCSYNPVGTVTGRLSSSGTVRNTGMNMQNLHPDFKGFIVAE